MAWRVICGPDAGDNTAMFRPLKFLLALLPFLLVSSAAQRRQEDHER